MHCRRIGCVYSNSSLKYHASTAMGSVAKRARGPRRFPALSLQGQLPPHRGIFGLDLLLRFLSTISNPKANPYRWLALLRTVLQNTADGTTREGQRPPTGGTQPSALMPAASMNARCPPLPCFLSGSSLRPSLPLTLAQFTKPSSGHLNLSFSPCRLQASLSKRLPSPRK